MSLRGANIAVGMNYREVVTGVQRIQAEMGKISGSVQSLTSKFSGLGGMIAGAFAVGGVSSAITSTVNAASDLNETISKTEQIFGSGAGEIKRFAETAASSLGLSKQAAMDGAAVFATFGKAAGLSGKELTTFSTNLLTLSSDLASFYNTSPEDAIQAIGAALRGEMEPIRRYGVLLDDATLRQVALKNGIVDSIKTALNPQQKALAANLAIFQQTTDAQGDFTRTSDGLANATRILNAEFQNAKALLGQELLPLITRFVTKITPAISDLMKYGRAAFGTMSSADIKKVEAQAEAVAKVKTTQQLQSALNREQEEYNKLVQSQSFVITDAEYRERIMFKARLNAIRQEYEARVELYKQSIAQVNLDSGTGAVGTGGAGGEQINRTANSMISMQPKTNIGSIVQEMESLPSKLEGVNAQIEQPLSDLQMTFNQTLSAIKMSMERFVTDTIVDFAAAIGESMAGGTDSMKNFGQMFLGNLGAFMKQLGSMYVALGAAQLAASIALTTPGPQSAAGLIAAGAAMAAIGGAITAVSREYATKGSTSGGSYNSYGGNYEFEAKLYGRDMVIMGSRNESMNRRVR